MKPIALVTCAEYPDLPPDDLPLLRALDARVVEAHAVRWNDAAADWSRYRAAIVRATWDYCDHYDTFVEWVNRAGRIVELYNSPRTILWNSRKNYLADLERQNISIPETAWFSQGVKIDIRVEMSRRGWREAVMKPVVGATARLAMRIGIHNFDAAQVHADACLLKEDMLLQEFQSSVLTEGEFSYIFIRGEFSHAVRKLPAAGDFRVQSEHRGTTAPLAADPRWVEHAARILTFAPDPPLYARVDFVLNNYQLPALMELELIEPELYFRPWPGSENRLAAAIAEIA